MDNNEKSSQRDNVKETREGLKEVNKIIFLKNEDFPDDWTEFDLTNDEKKILKEGEDYIDKVLTPSLSINRKVSKKELEDKNIDREIPKEELTQEKDINIRDKENYEEILEINNLLKQKAKDLKNQAKEDKYTKLKREKEEDEEKKKKELLERNR